MERRKFIKTAALAGTAMIGLHQFARAWDNEPTIGAAMPVLFVGHGSPMNAIEQNKFNAAWKELGKNLPAPKAIMVVSAHWETVGTKVTAMARPMTIHDFGGFPKELHEAQYPAPGSPEFAKTTTELLSKWQVHEDHTWGLDHGTWSVLMPMYPEAKIPVYQMSLDVRKKPEEQFALAQDLYELRKRGVLIIGSGNIVHNLRMIKWDDSSYDWAIAFNNTVKEHISKGDNYMPLIQYSQLENSRYAIPTAEHYLPLLYALGLKTKTDTVSFFNDVTTNGSIAMTGLLISGAQ
ncbi:MAG: 4,5-DOPA dioxygenase extradiol [Cytophaga sp.]|uniref:4,5-DOPA-extradiol-dioxygenase n=1 Tax=Cytophaga sp. TaxID=29535 RepID=UPI003F80E28B